MKRISLLFISALSLFSCTENEIARNYGGVENIELPKNCKILNATWKGDDLWICYTDTVTNISYLKEKSSWGILEGTIIFNDFSDTITESDFEFVK